MDGEVAGRTQVEEDLRLVGEEGHDDLRAFFVAAGEAAKHPAHKRTHDGREFTGGQAIAVVPGVEGLVHGVC